MTNKTEPFTDTENSQQQHFDKSPEITNTLIAGQKPQTLLICCSDSKIDPELLMGCEHGELFVLRHIANLVPPYQKNDDYHGVSASLEYAVCCLEVSNIIILGHSRCDSLGVLMQSADSDEEGEFVDKWIKIAVSARDKVLYDMPKETPEKQARACEKAAILTSLRNLMTFPWINKRVHKEILKLHGWYYSGGGQVQYYNQLSKKFEALINHNLPD